MISIIVPVYNVDLYLEKCLDSTINQSYMDIEVLVIDDGSTDKSGSMCDMYADKDARITVFHTKNQGLSCSRNIGLDNANGEWIGFVDSDDWIEQNMYELLLKRAEETGADVVESGIYQEYTNRSVEKTAISDYSVSGISALEALIRGDIQTQVWNKLWRKELFNNIRFPEGRDYEDISTTYKLIGNAKVVGIARPLYHYIKRTNSISQNHCIKNLVDNWQSHKERYEDLIDKVGIETKKELLKYCAYSIARVWAWYLISDKNSKAIAEMRDFTRDVLPVLGYAEWPLSLRFYILLSRYNNVLSFFIAFVSNQLYRLSRLGFYFKG